MVYTLQFYHFIIVMRPIQDIMDVIILLVLSLISGSGFVIQDLRGGSLLIILDLQVIDNTNAIIKLHGLVIHILVINIRLHHS